MIRWKVVAFTGGGAFVLSFLLGIASASPFFTILFRAILFGIIFALLGGGAAFLLERFIPQVLGGEGSSARKNEKSENVDIVIGEENPLREGEIEELVIDEVEQGQEQSAEETPPGIQALDEESPVAEEENPETLNATMMTEMESDMLEEEERKAEEVEEKPAALVEEKPHKAGKEDVVSESDLDVLPDMSGFESSFSPINGGEAVNESLPFEGMGTTLKTKKFDQDPATYVKAVRTIIKREEGKKR